MKDSLQRRNNNHKRGAQWERSVAFYDGDTFFDALESEIQHARRSILMETYIFASDRLGDRILRALHEAVLRGVEVRVIIDGLGSYSWSTGIRRRAEELGIKIKIFHQVPWLGWWSPPATRKRWYSWGRAFQRVNRRNHRKVCVIDERLAFVGSMNIIEYHVARYVGPTAWRDTGVRVEGREVSILVDSFNALWGGGKRGIRLFPRRRKVASGEQVFLNLHRHQRRENYLNLLVRMLGAKDRIWIENAYFVPDSSLIRVLRVAAESGVDVRIIVPAFSDVVFIPWVASAFHLGLLRAGARVFEYTKSVLHAKSMIIDGWGLVGSSNLNHRSLLHDLEADVALTDPEVCRSLQDQFVRDCASSQEVTLDTWNQRSIVERCIGWVLLAVRRVL